MKTTRFLSASMLTILIAVFGSCKQTIKNTESSSMVTPDSLEMLFLKDSALTRLWFTPHELLVPESVIFDEASEVLYVSCIQGNSMEVDSQGYIARLSVEGEILDREWVTGLSAPKGMGIFGNSLFVSDIQYLVEIDMAEAQITHRYLAEGARFLNDVAIDTEGRVYVSDTRSQDIYRLAEGKMEKWISDTLLQSPNGLFVEGDRLLIGTASNVLMTSLETPLLSVYIDSTGRIDGIEKVAEGVYIISDWQGNIHLAYPDRPLFKLLDSTPAKVNAADIEYIPERQMLLVPTFMDNRVFAYHLKR